MFERPDPDLIDGIRTALSDPDPGRQSCALFDVEDCVSAVMLLAWNGAEGQTPAQRFAAALQAALAALRGLSRAMAAQPEGAADG